MVAAVFVIEKLYDDFEISITRFSRTVNIPISALKEMEITLLQGLDWKTLSSEQEFE